MWAEIKKYFFSCNIAIKFFICTLVSHFGLCALPSIYRYGRGFWLCPNKIFDIVKFFYFFVKDLSANLVGAVFFFIVFEMWSSKIKAINELEYLIGKYKQMKKDILKVMIMAVHNGLWPENIDYLIDTMFLGHQECEAYFTKENFHKMYNNLDDNDIKTIVRKMNIFLQYLDSISAKYVEDGNFVLRNIFDDIQEMRDGIEDQAPFDWFPDLSYKSFHPLYRLFCQKDPYYLYFVSLLKEYNSPLSHFFYN